MVTCFSLIPCYYECIVCTDRSSLLFNYQPLDERTNSLGCSYGLLWIQTFFSHHYLACSGSPLALPATFFLKGSYPTREHRRICCWRSYRFPNFVDSLMSHKLSSYVIFLALALRDDQRKFTLGCKCFRFVLSATSFFSSGPIPLEMISMPLM